MTTENDGCAGSISENIPAPLSNRNKTVNAGSIKIGKSALPCHPTSNFKNCSFRSTARRKL
jgi:hypothetical protein